MFKRKKNSCAGVVGVTFFSDGVALAQLECHGAAAGDGTAGVRLKVIDSESCSSGEHGATLSTLVDRNRLHNSPCAAVMARGSYSLIQVDKPDVPQEELRDAVRWQIKDLLDFPAEEAVIDLFTDGGVGVQGKTFVVAAQQGKVGHVVEAVRGAGLELMAIDIPELALRNLLARVAENERGVALLTLWQDNGMITIVRAGELCMARRINIGYRQLLTAADNEQIAGVEISQAQQNILDDVVLEIQRSLDYYESSVSRQAVSALLLAPTIEPVPGLQEYIGTYLAPDVRTLELGKLFAAEALDSSEEARCLSAIGVAMRSDLC